MPLDTPAEGSAQDGAPAVPAGRAQRHWVMTSRLMWSMLALWALASFGVHLAAPEFNRIHVLGFPLGYYMAAQGSLVVFVVGLVWFARFQGRIDEACGVQEEPELPEPTDPPVQDAGTPAAAPGPRRARNA